MLGYKGDFNDLLCSWLRYHPHTGLQICAEVVAGTPDSVRCG